MNNSTVRQFTINESKVDVSPMLRQKEKELLEIIDAIQNIYSSSYWKVLEEKVFSGLVEGLDRKLRTESDHQKSAWLQGAISIAEKYQDFKKFEETYRLELTRVRSSLQNNGKENPGDGSPTSS